MTITSSKPGQYLSIFLFLAGTSLQATDSGHAEHVIVMVWDGMRPDFVRPQYTPALYRLAQRGTFFRHHHPVFVSSTEVNGAAMITGAQPDHSGIVANKEYWPQLSWTESGAMEGLDVVRRGDALSDGHYIQSPTLTEIIQQAGFRTVVAGTKAVALLLDRSNQRTNEAARNSVNVYHGRSLPKSALEGFGKGTEEKAFPTNVTYPNVAQDAWTTKTLVRDLWKKDVPKFSMIWLSDPDYTQHDSGPGSNASLESYESADKNLALVVKTLEDKGVLEKTDIFVVSDHGFSTIGRGIDLAAVLKRAGFRAVRKFDDPEPGEVLVVGLGGSVALYVMGHDEPTVRSLIEFLQTTDFAGVIFSKVEAPGTFPLSAIRLQTTNAPDILVSLRWNNGTNEFGTPGLITADVGKGAKAEKGGGTKDSQSTEAKEEKGAKGAHASLSKFDMRNTLVAAGPDIRQQFLDDLPTGNADLAPTILWILGIKHEKPMDGRVLLEALMNVDQSPPRAEQKTIEAARANGWFLWQQYLTFSKIGDAIYIDEGNGEAVSKGVKP